VPDRLLKIDADRFAAVLGKTSMGVEHGLAGHALLTLDAVARLAQKLPAASIEHNLGDIPLVAADGKVRSLQDAPEDVVRTIEANGSWMVLKNVEQDPAYRALLDELLDEVKPLVGSREGGMQKREAFIFVSAPGSITPSHVDPEHNFLLQVRGTKQMNVGTFADRKAEQGELERVYSGGHRNIEQLPDAVESYDMQPGDGVYVRPDAPHFVVNGPEASVSLSITWRTPSTRRAARVHRINGRLRRLRLDPRGPGHSPGRDRIKEAAGRVDAAVERLAARTGRR
jgi:hypothetical protein